MVSELDVKLNNLFEQMVKDKKNGFRDLNDMVDLSCLDCRGHVFFVLVHLGEIDSRVQHLLRCKKCGRYKFLDKFLRDI